MSLVRFLLAMATMHVIKPLEQKQNCPETCKNKTNIEHQSFTNKMKGMTDKMFHQNKAQQHGTNAPKTGLLGMTDKLFNHNKEQHQHGTNAPKTGLLGITDKLFHYNKEQQNGTHAAKTGVPPGSGLCNNGANKMERKKLATKKEGNCIPKRNDYKKKSKSEGNCSDSSDSGSDSDNDKCSEKKRSIS